MDDTTRRLRQVIGLVEACLITTESLIRYSEMVLHGFPISNADIAQLNEIGVGVLVATEHLNQAVVPLYKDVNPLDEYKERAKRLLHPPNITDWNFGVHAAHTVLDDLHQALTLISSNYRNGFALYARLTALVVPLRNLDAEISRSNPIVLRDIAVADQHSAVPR